MTNFLSDRQYRNWCQDEPTALQMLRDHNIIRVEPPRKFIPTYRAPEKVVRNFCLVLPGRCLAIHAYLFRGLCINMNAWGPSTYDVIIFKFLTPTPCPHLLLIYRVEAIGRLLSWETALSHPSVIFTRNRKEEGWTNKKGWGRIRSEESDPINCPPPPRSKASCFYSLSAISQARMQQSTLTTKRPFFCSTLCNRTQNSHSLSYFLFFRGTPVPLPV